MKLFHLLALALVMASGTALFAQPAKGLKISKITGTVNIMKNGAIAATLKPGAAIPVITDNKVSFSIMDGTVEVEAGGKKISGATGANFTITAVNGQINVALGAGTPVAVKSESVHNIVLTAGSEIKMARAGSNVQIIVVKGNAVITDASGGGTQTLLAGQAASVPSAPLAVPEPMETFRAPPSTVNPIDEIEQGCKNSLLYPCPSVIPTQEVIQEGCEVSASSPDCN